MRHYHRQYEEWPVVSTAAYHLVAATAVEIKFIPKYPPIAVSYTGHTLIELQCVIFPAAVV